MKKIKQLFILSVVALAGLSLAACGEDDLDTNQYLQGVHLNVYGPQPVMRGGMLRFLGSNLDQVASVTIPGVPAITNIEVIKSGIPSEIRVQVPKDGPEVGPVVLTTKTNEIIKTKTELTYEEPIDFKGFSPASAMPGEVITIEGDYLNLIHMVEFTDGVQVSENDFAYHDRYKIQVAVPDAAKTGKISLYTADLTALVDANADVSYNIIKSEEALNVGTPTVSKLASPRGEAAALGTVVVKQGEPITVTGTYFGLIETVNVADVELQEFNASADGKTLSFVLPAEAPDGDINLICRSGVEVPVGKIETVAPSNCSATPNPAKAGGRMIVKGDDLDVVTAVQFDNADPVEFNLTGAGILISAIPETAQEGEGLTLRMANGKEVKVPFTLVKPVVTVYNANPVSAGAVLVIKGTDLDLVKSITFGEATNDEDKFEATETSITVTVPMEAKTGKPLLNLKNGTQVEAPELAIKEAVFCYITEMPEFGDDNTPQAGDVLTVKVKNADKLEKVFVNGAEVKYVYSEKNEQLTFGIPDDATAKSVVKLVSSNGEVEYEISVIPNNSQTIVIFEGPASTGFWSNNLTLPSDAFKNLPAGVVTMIISYQVELPGGKIKFNDGHWANIKLAGCVGDGEYFYEFDENQNEARIPLSASDLQHLTDDAILDWGGSMFINGQDITINKISLEIEFPTEDTVWEGNMDIDWNVGGALSTLAYGGYDWSTVKAGTILRCYYEKKVAGDWGCASLRHGDSWGNLPDSFGAQYDFPEASGVFEISLTQAAIDDLVANQGLIITGTNFILTKVTME